MNAETYPLLLSPESDADAADVGFDLRCASVEFGVFDVVFGVLDSAFILAKPEGG